MSNVWELAQDEFIALNKSIEQHGSIGFFGSLPRWPLSKQKYSSATWYVLHVCLSGGIPTFAGLIIVACLFIGLIARFTCLNEQFERRKHMRLRKRPLWNLKHIVTICGLTTFVVIMTGVGILGTLIVAEGSLNIVSALDGILRDVRLTGLAIMDLVLWMKERLANFDASKYESSSEEEEILFSAFSTLIAYGEPRLPNMVPLRDAISDLLGTIIGLIDMAGKVVVLLFSVMIVGFLICSMGSITVGICGACTGTRRGCVIFGMTCFIFLPLLFSWAFLGIWTVVGIGISDGCEITHGYRDVLLVHDEPAKDHDNPLVSTGVICSSSFRKTESVVDRAVEAFVGNALAVSTATILLNVSSSDMIEVVTWGTERIRPYINCDLLVSFSGKLESLACGRGATSVAAGLQYIWISWLVLCLALSVSFVALCCDSHDTTKEMLTPRGVRLGATCVGGGYSENDGHTDDCSSQSGTRRNESDELSV